ncbi:MAG: divergent PAP2 family protein [Spirochaetota bacterium]
MLPVAVPLIVAVIAQLLCQIFKVVAYSIRDRALSLHYFTTAGGMPSAHAAFVTALTVAVGLSRGFDSELFAVSFVFSAIIVYDAYRLRGHVEQQAKVLNRLQQRLRDRLDPSDQARLSEMVGHSVPEILAGMIFGGGFALLAHTVLTTAGVATVAGAVLAGAAAGI